MEALTQWLCLPIAEKALIIVMVNNEFLIHIFVISFDSKDRYSDLRNQQVNHRGSFDDGGLEHRTEQDS